MKVKNIKFVKSKLVPLLLAGSIGMSLVGCNGHVDMNSISFGDLLEISDVQDDTLVDELIKSGRLLFDEDISYIEAADMLERYMDISDKLKDIDFCEVDSLKRLSQEEYNSTLDYSLEDVNDLIEIIKNSKSKSLVDQENRLTAYKKLDFLNDYCDTFIHTYGEDISLSVMFASVKGSIADELDLAVDDYSSITIPKYHDAGDGSTSYCVEVGDKSYTVPVSNGEIWNTINYIYTLQRAKLTEETEKPTYRKAINYAKTTMAAGANINKDKVRSDHSAGEISKNYLK